MRLERGVARVVLGTAAYENPELVKKAVKLYNASIAVGIDARDGFVAVRGWADKTQITPIELACRMMDAGVTTIIYTDIARDGMLTGPNVAAIREMVRKTGLQVIASGGVGNINDIAALKSAGARGVVVGKALYSGAVKLEEALAMEGED